MTIFDADGFIHVATLEGIPVFVSKVPETSVEYQSTRVTDKRYIVIHNAGNAHADDTANNRFMKQDDYILWHFTVDEDSITQGHSILRSGYHAGDGGSGKGNLYGIGIEIADNGNVAKACENAFVLCKALQQQSPFTALELEPHQFFSGKYCPQWILDNWGWQGFILRYEAYLQATSVPAWKTAIVHESHVNQIITDLERWMRDIDTPMPTWAVLASINNAYRALLMHMHALASETDAKQETS
ncbi:peptidoglycan recognition protein family protein [Fusibacter paucivorans]|uniref:peptidoglycan recognition protein family protein n=1 Tax=Fusibacter paucivorans TaxID=76009 RepID=UPI001BCDC619|nr:N-acetylmuramoyl-L-alanine amidase [Fusibacter paucivorans]